MNIREILREIVGIDGAMGISFLAIVTDINASQYSCSVKTIGNGTVLEDVRLKAEFKKTYGIALIPKKGSFVVVTVLAASGGAYINLCSEVEKIEMKIENSELVINKDGFEFNGGLLHGMVKIGDLITKLNTLEKQMGTHQHLYIPVPGAMAVPTAPDVATNPIIIPTQQTELENTKILQ